MKLHELHIGEHRARPGGKRHALAEIARKDWSCRVVETADAAGRKDDCRGQEAIAACPARMQAAHRAIVRHQSAPSMPSMTVIDGCSADGCRQRPDELAAPVPSPAAWTIRRRRWAASRPSRKRAVGAPVEAHAEAPGSRWRRAAASAIMAATSGSHSPSPAASVSARCSSALSSAPKARRDAALCPGARRLRRRAPRG